MTARFESRAIVSFEPDGRHVRLEAEFAFVDNEEKRWRVPKGALVDGASIPRPLWSLIGGPFEGRYRDASIVHDWYCDVRSEPWMDVHRMFYAGMITSGAPTPLAKLMYAGVYWGGPRWSSIVSGNVNLALEEWKKRGLTELEATEEMAVARPTLEPPKSLFSEDVDRLSDLIAQQDPSLDELERIVEAARDQPP